MRTIYKVIPLLIIMSCSGSNDEIIKKKIIQKEQQITKIEQQIEDLKKQLSDSTDNDKAVAVKIKELEPESFDHYIIAYGEVKADDYAMISPEIGGQVLKVYADEGQYVTEGTLIVSLNTSATENSIKSLKANLELADTTFKKQKRLYEQNIGSEIQYLQAKATKESLEAQLKSLQSQKRMSKIYAPFSGYVDKIFLKQGEMAAPGMPVVEMVNLKKISIQASLSEEYLGKLKKGQEVKIGFNAFPDLSIPAPIKRIGNVIDKDSRTFEIETSIENRDEKIKPNMVSKITINDYSADSALVIPSFSVKKDINGSYVYVVENNQTKKKYVETGYSYNDLTEVTTGLVPGDRVIVKGHSLVSSGVKVSIKND